MPVGGRTLDGARISDCSSCDAPIVWTVMDASGKANPLNVKPDPDGRLVVVSWQATEKGMAPVARALKRDEWTMHTGARYTSHFATCPKADEHRRRT